MIGYSFIDDDDPIEVKKPVRQADISPEREIVQKDKIAKAERDDQRKD